MMDSVHRIMRLQGIIWLKIEVSAKEYGSRPSVAINRSKPMEVNLYQSMLAQHSRTASVPIGIIQNNHRAFLCLGVEYLYGHLCASHTSVLSIDIATIDDDTIKLFV